VIDVVERRYEHDRRREEPPLAEQPKAQRDRQQEGPESNEPMDRESIDDDDHCETIQTLRSREFAL